MSVDPAAIAFYFTPAASISGISPCGRGLINDTFLVARREDEPFILQRLNPAVFPDPEAISHNLRVVCAHLAARHAQAAPKEKWQTSRILPTLAGADFHRDPQGCCWRAQNFINETVTHQQVTSEAVAEQAGLALGRFQRLLHDLNPARLRDLLPTFHVTPHYLARYDALAGAGQPPETPENRFCRRFIAERRAGAAILEQARARGILPERVIHGDPKISNILFDRENGEAVAMIDLDTVKPGLTQYDVGDCLRSCCNRAAEEVAEPEAASFDLDLGRAVLRGYLSEMRPLLTYCDFAYFYEAAHLISFELGLRFFTAYLAQSDEFKPEGPEHNLRRALAQFRLTASIEAQERRIREIIRELS